MFLLISSSCRVMLFDALFLILLFMIYVVIILTAITGSWMLSSGSIGETLDRASATRMSFLLYISHRKADMGIISLQIFAGCQDPI